MARTIGSSSTTSTVSCPATLPACGSAGVSLTAGSPVRGRKILNVEPRPYSL
jgi:hypothetical protein